MARYFTDQHEWIDIDGDAADGVRAKVGITDYAQGQLGDIVFVELPAIGTTLTQGGEAAVVESVKAASDVYSPIDGEVVEGNAALEEDPAIVNTSPEDAGWFYAMRVADPSQLEALMDQTAYTKFIAEL